MPSILRAEHTAGERAPDLDGDQTRRDEHDQLTWQDAHLFCLRVFIIRSLYLPPSIVCAPKMRS